jgi:hypothetical protein
MGRKVSGQQVRGNLLVKQAVNVPHILLTLNIVILANLTSLLTSVKEFLVLSFIMVYPPACPKHLIDALERAVNALPAS